MKNSIALVIPYINTYFNNIDCISKDNRVKVGCYGFVDDYSFDSNIPYSSIEALFNEDTLFLNHNDDGLTDSLKEYIIKKFNKPSKYELIKQ
jgi:hypothetical protein